MIAIATIHPDDQPDLVPVRDRLLGRTWYRVRQRWEWVYGPITIIAERGYRVDAASVPRLLWTLTGYTPDGSHRAASLAHDVACDNLGRLYPGKKFGAATPYVLYAGPHDECGCAVAQMTSPQVHRLWREFLLATDGHRRSASFIKWFGVRVLGPRWKRQLAAPIDLD